MAEEKKNTTKKKTTKKAPAKTTKKTTKATSKPTTRKSTTKVVQEENHYGKTLLAAILIIIVFIGGYVAVEYQKNKNGEDTKYVATADEKKFKEDYESLNGTTRSNGQTNRKVEILVDNNIEYINLEKAAKILEDGSGIIYFGFPACPWCRNAVPVLLNAMDSSELDKIYYVDVRPDDKPENDIRDTYTLNTKNKAKKTKDADKAYYDVLTLLANELEDYVLTTDSGKKVNTGEKRLMAPTVVAVANGEIIGFHVGTVENHDKDDKGALRDLTKKEETELLNTYTKMISKYLSSDCNDDTGC